jgi:DNA-binding MarR family transcriptional regulator
MAPEAEPAAVIDALTRAAAQVQRALDLAASEYGVSPTLARLLRELRGALPTINELARQLGLDKSSASGLVDRAQGRGLVRRVPSQLDRRSVRVRLTTAGHQLAAEIAADAAEELAAVLEPLSPAERSALVALLGRFSGS